MGFEKLVNEKPAKANALDIADGARLQFRRLRRGERETRFLMLTIGRQASRKLALQSENTKVHLLFGTGEDKGQLAITVDNTDGAFMAKRNKQYEYIVPIPMASVTGKVNVPFETIYCKTMEIKKLDPTKPVFGIIDISAAAA